jgi:hypothetical protein
MKVISPKIAPFGFAQGTISSWLIGAVVRFPQGSQRVHYLLEITLRN